MGNCTICISAFLDNGLSYLWKEEWQDDKADPVDYAGKLESIGNCWKKKHEKTLSGGVSKVTVRGSNVFLQNHFNIIVIKIILDLFAHILERRDLPLNGNIIL